MSQSYDFIVLYRSGFGCYSAMYNLTHRGRVMHLYASIKYAIIGSVNGLVPFQHRVIFWTNVDLLLLGPLRTYSSKM